MDTLNSLLHGFTVALTFHNLFWALLGCMLGTAIGVLPGIGPALTVAMLLPMTAQVEPTGALIMFAGIYYGAMFGGSTTSILLNTPGESASMVTALEGNKMARNGRAGAALATSAIGSFVAGIISTVLLAAFAPTIVDFALQFGPAEYFMLAMLAFITVSSVLGNSAIRGLLSLFVGVFFGMLGVEQSSGISRFDFGLPELVDGLDVVVVAVGLFAIGETLYNLVYERKDGAVQKVSGSLWMTRDDWRRSWKAWLRGTGLGFPFGCIPAGGSEIPTFLSYATEKKLSKNPEEFGHGAIEGVAGPEAANNANSVGVMVPLLTLGIPTGATAAIILAAFQQYGLQPGPLLFQTSADLVWGLIASMFIGNAMLLVLNLPLIGVWVKMLSIPRHYLYAGILIFATLGAYGIRQSSFDLFLLLAIGVMGFVMRRFDFPVAPVIIGMVLGPMAEKQLRNALSISQGNWMTFVERPISLIILILILLVVLLPYLAPILRQMKGDED